MSIDLSDFSAEASARRVLERCVLLSGLSESPDELTRTFLCPAMHAVHETLSEWMMQAGLEVSVDGAGNLIGHYPAAQEPAQTLLLGSHLDTVPNAGAYDGVLGVLLALAAIESLPGGRLPFAVDILGFSEEEGVRYGTPYLGSLAIAQGLSPTLLTLQDKGGLTVADAILAFGLAPNDANRPRYRKSDLVGYIEAHIEQGPVLERLGLPLGIVDAIAGQSRFSVTLTGQAGHAGTTPMVDRRDALAGAGEMVLAIEALAGEVPDLVATVGRIAVTPNASNVIPGVAEFSLDVRHARDAVREQAVSDLHEAITRIAQRRHLLLSWEQQSQQPAVAMDSVLSGQLAQAVIDTGQPIHTLVSGAGHDAAIMAGLTPCAMLFLRSPGGLSHHPDEAVLPGDVAAAALALSHLLERLGQTISGGTCP